MLSHATAAHLAVRYQKISRSKYSVVCEVTKILHTKKGLMCIDLYVKDSKFSVRIAVMLHVLSLYFQFENVIKSMVNFLFKAQYDWQKILSQFEMSDYHGRICRVVGWITSCPKMLSKMTE